MKLLWNDIFKEYNNIYHAEIKIKSINVKLTICIDFGVENNDNDNKFEDCHHVRISKYRNILPKSCIPNWSEDVLHN